MKLTAVILHVFLVDHLTMMSVSKLYNVDQDKTIREWGPVGEMTIDWETEVLGANFSQCHFDHHEYQMT
jgi:hypothetical protein